MRMFLHREVRQQLGHPDLPYFVGGMPDDLFFEEN